MSDWVKDLVQKDKLDTASATLTVSPEQVVCLPSSLF